jgi:inosine-uridine nucleoside N-ribohydrolase
LRSTSLAVILGSLLLVPAASQSANGGEPVRLIFDTDICGDCDDVLALAMIHSLQSRGACRLLAVTVSVRHAQAAPFVDAVNTFYGRGKIPIGVVGADGVAQESRFLALAQQKDGGQLRFPHDSTFDHNPPTATEVLRKTLAAQPDGSVSVVQVGFSTNLARLLDSPPDDHSALLGEELVRRKVKRLSLMAGAFTPIGKKARFLEYNVVKDIASCRTLAERWPSPMVWSGYEVGTAIPYPAVSIERDYGYVAHHPVAEAYVRFKPPPHERPTWDLTSVLYAVYPDRGYFDLSPPGTVTVEADGFTAFTPNPEGRQRYLIVRPDQAIRAREAFAQLASQPPNVNP